MSSNTNCPDSVAGLATIARAYCIGTHGKNLVVGVPLLGKTEESYPRFRSEVIDVTFNARVPQVVTVFIESRHHDAVPLQDVINFLLPPVLMRSIGASRRKIDNIKIRSLLGCVDPVYVSVPTYRAKRAHQ